MLQWYTWRRKRKSQGPELLKGYPVDFPQQWWTWDQEPDATTVCTWCAAIRELGWPWDRGLQRQEGCCHLTSTGPASPPGFTLFLQEVSLMTHGAAVRNGDYTSTAWVNERWHSVCTSEVCRCQGILLITPWERQHHCRHLFSLTFQVGKCSCHSNILTNSPCSCYLVVMVFHLPFHQFEFTFKDSFTYLCANPGSHKHKPIINRIRSPSFPSVNLRSYSLG